jgi:peroxin-3
LLAASNRRFQQNQEDCTFTVQALLPTATENITKELPVESLTQELQQKKAARIARSATASTTDAGSDTGASTSFNPSVAATPGKDEDTQSLRSFASESFNGVPQPESDSAPAAAARTPRKTKLQLWDEIKITCALSLHANWFGCNRNADEPQLSLDLSFSSTHCRF